MEYPDGDSGTDGGCDVVAEAVVAYTFGPTCRVEYIDSHGGSCYCCSSERNTVEGAEDGEHRDGCGYEVTCRDGYKQEKEQ